MAKGNSIVAFLGGVVTTVAIGAVGLAIVLGPREAKHDEAYRQVIEERVALEKRLDQALAEVEKTRAYMAKAVEKTEAVVNEVTVLRAQVKEKDAQIETLQAQQAASLKDSVKEAASEVASAKTPANGKVFRFGLGKKTAVFDNANWAGLSTNILDMSKEMPDLMKRLTSGKPLDPALAGKIQKMNMPLAMFAVQLSTEIEGENANDAYTHPAVMANFIRGILEAAGDPLTEAQLNTVANLGAQWETENAAIEARASDNVFALKTLYQKVEAKTRFLDLVSGQLTSTQSQIVFNPETQGRVGLDLISPALIYIQRWPVQNVALDKLKVDATNKLLALAGVADESKRPEDYRFLTDDWLQNRPGALQALPRTSREVMFPHISNLQKSVAAQLKAMDELLKTGDLNEEQSKALKASTTVLLPQLIAANKSN